MPIIEKIAQTLQLSTNYIKKIEENASRRYKKYKIPKRHNLYRVIYQPSQELKTIQYWINHYIFNLLPVSDFSFAYDKGCSIKKNAIFHKDSKHFLHIDIESFFESITERHLRKLLSDNNELLKSKNVKLLKEDINFICKICLRNGRLTIGSVSSPNIANRVMYEFDLKIKNQIPDNILYTRYADDLVFSSKEYISKDIINKISVIAKEFSFNLNKLKTYFMSNSGRKIVTGLIIDNGRVSIGLRRRKQIKSMLYNKLVKGEGDSEKILGHLFFLKDIEPGYLNKIIIKYSYLGNVMELLRKDKAINSILKSQVNEAAAGVSSS